MTISGTNTFMILLNKKFCTPCVPVAPSAASRFLFMVSMLWLNARSNLSDFTTSNVPVRVLFAAFTSPPLIAHALILQTTVLAPKAWVNMDLILIFTPTLVHGLTTKLVIALDS